MISEERAVCPANDGLVEKMREWWRDMAENKPKYYTENRAMTIKMAFTNVCRHKTHIKSIDDFLKVKGIGKWFVGHFKEFFNNDSGASQSDAIGKEGKKPRGSRPYLPKKNSCAYALLITLYRRMENGTEYMQKQDLIDAAEASGLSQAPIGPEKGKGKQGRPGSSAKEWYSGWSTMGTLITKGLVVKSGCPAKYMLTDAGRATACECLSRSDMISGIPNMVNNGKFSNVDKEVANDLDLLSSDSVEDVILSSVDMITSDDVSVDILGSVSDDSAWNFSLSSEDHYKDDALMDSFARATVRSGLGVGPNKDVISGGLQNQASRVHMTPLKPCTTFEPRVKSSDSCSSSDFDSRKTSHSNVQVNQNSLRLPPLSFMAKFKDEYDVILILDDRERFVRSRSKNLISDVCQKFGIVIRDARLPVGDAVWVAHHKHNHTEYVLDVIVERKNVEDLRSSIRDNRYKDQKMRLRRTGLRKIIYVVEGDPNVCEAADSIKTACFTTEVLERFDVQRTKGLGETLQLYGRLTQAIADYCELISQRVDCSSASSCLQYDEFIKKCEDLDKLTISEVFGIYLMQIPQVTEEVALAVVDCYPTLHSLACAYSLLDKDRDSRAQEELLMIKSNNIISAAVSRKIFQSIWK